jgi:hypothetical protein
MTRSLALMLMLSSLLAAQSISVTSPAGGQNISGTSVSLSISFTNLPSLYSVQYLINGESGVNYNANDTVRCASCSAAAYNLTWNSFYVNNGPQSIAAIARDALNNVLATSASVAFTVGNAMPDAPAYLSATYTIPSTESAWSGTKDITINWSGTHATNHKHPILWVDGNAAPGGVSDTTATSFTWHLDTTKYYNVAGHNIVVQTTDLSNGLFWAVALQDEFQATFSNSVSPVEIQSSAAELFFAPGGTAQTLTCQLRNTDLSLSACTTPSYSSSDTSKATVGASTGVVSPNGSNEGLATIAISANGLNRSVYVYVFAGAASGVPHFCKDGSIGTTPCAGGDMWLGSIFASGDDGNIFADPNFTADQYATAATAVGLPGVEPRIWDRRPSAGESQNSFQSYVDGFVAPWTSLAAAHPGLRLRLRTDGALGQTNWTYQNIGGLGSAWNPPAITYALQKWGSAPIIGAYGPDEVTNVHGACPLCSPLTVGSYGLTNVVADGSGGCTMNWSRTDWPLGSSGWFILHGSFTAGLNSVPATATATQSGGVVQSTITVTGGGSGYISTPTCSIVDSVGTGATCTATLTNGVVTSIARGSGGSGYTSGLTVNITPPNFHRTGGTSTSMAFSCPGVAAGTHTSGNDSGLTYEPYAAGWASASVADNAGYWSPFAQGTSNGPYVDYLHANAFQSTVTLERAASPRPAISWPPTANAVADPLVAGNWFNPSISDYNMLYTANSNGLIYLPHSGAGNGSQAQMDSSYRAAYNGLNHAAPVFNLGGPQNVGYGLQGYAIALSTCVNSLCTAAGDHGIRNIIDGDTRVQITGTYTAYDDNWYIARAPTATTFLIYGKSNFSASGATTGADGDGTLTLADGSIYTLASIASTTPSSVGIKIAPKNGTDVTCTLWNKRGQTAAISGSGGWAAYQGKTYYFSFNNRISQSPYACSGGNPPYFIYPLLSLSSSGGAATVQLNNKYVRGVNWPNPLSGQEAGPISLFGNALAGAIVDRSSGMTFYNAGIDPDGFAAGGEFWNASIAAYNQTWQTDNNFNINTTAIHPFYDAGGGKMMWESAAAGTRLMNRFAKFLYQPSVASPDYGYQFDCAAHDGHTTIGNILICKNYQNGPWTRTFNLSAYLVAGQPIVKYYGHWYDVKVSILSAGTASDTVNGDANTFVAYVFPTNTGAELVQPTISVVLADISNATKAIARCAYSQWLLANTPALTFDLGTGAGTLGIDPAIGPSYCNVQYLDTNGKVLATGAAQQF